MDLVLSFIFFLAMIAIGGGIGRGRERRHIAALDRRELAAAGIIVTDTQVLPAGHTDPIGAALVAGSVVIANDYLKTFLAKVRGIFGGELTSYATLLSRARREARMRMVDDAVALGAKLVVNIRFETSSIGNTQRQNAMPTTEILCFGTAVLPRR